MNSFRKIVSLLVTVAILCGAGGLLYALIGNRQNGFSVRYGNQTITEKATNLEFVKDGYTIIQCNSSTGQASEYEVVVVINSGRIESFPIVFDGNAGTFDTSECDCTELFGVVKYDGYFVFYARSDLTLTEIVQSKCPDYEITEVAEIDLWERDSFILIVTDKTTAAVIQIYF